MTAALAQPGALEWAGNGGVPARRAMIRWAWRLFRREWRQQLLVLVLITVAVAASVVGAAIGSNTSTVASGTFGSADALVTLPGSDPHLARDLGAIRDHFGHVEVIESALLDTGSATPVQVRAANPDGRFVRSMLSVVSGRYPTGPGQIALTRQLADRYRLRVGQTWGAAPGGPERVVGIVENPESLTDTFALVAAGQVARPQQVTALFEATRSQVGSFSFPAGATPELRPPPASGLTHQMVLLVVAVFGLIFVGLVSAAGFAVMAQRRLRALGMVGALGATDRNIALVLVANGAAVGLAGTLAGAAIGFAFWFPYAPHLQQSVNHVVDPAALPWWIIGTVMALAVLTAILAARWPARAAARVPVVSALSGRPTPPKAPHRFALPGAAVLAAGLLLLVAAGPTGNGAGTPGLMLLGIVATIVGGLLFAPLAIAGLAKLAPRAPLAVRLAWRDLARYRSRSGAALGAVSLAVTLAVIVCVAAGTRSANALDYVAPNLASNQLVVNAPPPGGPLLLPATATPSSSQTPPSQAQMRARAGRIARAVGANSVLGLVASNATLSAPSHRSFQNFNGTVYVATPELLHHYGIAPGDIRPGTDILTSRPGLDTASPLDLVALPAGGGRRVGPGPGLRPGLVPGGPGSPTATTATITHPVIQETHKLPTGTDAPNVVITEQALRRLGLQVGAPSAWLLQASRPFTATQGDTAEALAAAAGMTVTTRSSQPSLRSLETWSTVAGLLLALGILAMTSGLIRSETAGDLRTLTATGASSRVRRVITAATAGGVGLLGGVLGVATGVAGLVAFYSHQLHAVLAGMPVGQLLILALGLPAAAALGGLVFAGREPPAIAHQPIE